MKKIRILLADDHAILRAGLELMIGSEPDMEVVAEAGDALEALRKTGAAPVDVVVMDLTMPGMSALEAIERIRSEHPSTRVLVLTMHDDPAYARASLAAGASGHVVKDAEAAELLAAIRAVHRGRRIVAMADPPQIPDALARSSGAQPAPAADAHLLSPRERQVLALVAHGYTNREVADRLVLSVKTVETYRARLAEKLGLRTRADLVRLAIDLGLLSGGIEGPDGPA